MRDSEIKKLCEDLGILSRWNEGSRMVYEVELEGMETNGFNPTYELPMCPGEVVMLAEWAKAEMAKRGALLERDAVMCSGSMPTGVELSMLMYDGRRTISHRADPTDANDMATVTLTIIQEALCL